MGLLTFQYFSLASVSDIDPESSTFCPGVGAMKILRSLTEPEAAESPPDPADDDEGKSSREILMARYFERCSTRAVVVVLMNLW